MASNKRQLSADTKAATKQVSQPNPYKHDVIVSDRGQWDYPGQVTKILSGDITMKNVPYPVMGNDNLGNQKLMMPNQDYMFPGNSVTEYPMMNSNNIDMKKLKVQQRGGPANYPGRPENVYPEDTYPAGVNPWEGDFYGYTPQPPLAAHVDHNIKSYQQYYQQPQPPPVYQPDVTGSFPEEEWNVKNYGTPNPAALRGFQMGGGASEYVDMELSDEDIEYYRSLGYQVDEL